MASASISQPMSRVATTENFGELNPQQFKSKIQPGIEKLDTLLLKAESFSHFILEHQKQAKAQQEAILALKQKEEQRKKEAKEKFAPGSSPKRARSEVSPSGKSTNKVRNKNTKKTSYDLQEQEHETTKDQLSLILEFQQPSNLVGGKLMPYQLEGLQWLISLWENGISGILADEMGLGINASSFALFVFVKSLYIHLQ